MSNNMKKNAQYKIDFTNNTVTITKKFAEEAGIVGTEAFKVMKELRSMGMTIVEKAPVKHKTNIVTYKKMEKYINTLTTAEADMKEFEQVKLTSQGQKNPYQFVLKWYNQKFASREKNTELDNGKIVSMPRNNSSKEAATSYNF